MPLAEDAIQAGRRRKTRGTGKFKAIAITRGIMTCRTSTSPLRIAAGVRPFAEPVCKEVACPLVRLRALQPS